MYLLHFSIALIHDKLQIFSSEYCSKVKYNDTLSFNECIYIYIYIDQRCCRGPWPKRGIKLLGRFFRIYCFLEMQ